MKNLVRLKTSGGWLVALLGLLGFAASCDKSSDQRLEYGTPSADYQVLGSVRLSGNDQPVSGVRVQILYKSPDGTYHNDYGDWLPATQTDGDGRFDIERQGMFPGEAVPLEFSKPGEVQTDTVEVSFEGVPLSGKKGWYWGKASKSIEVELTPAANPVPASKE